MNRLAPLADPIRRRTALPGHRREAGSVIIVMMTFVLVFIIVGVSLYWLVASHTRATETERTDVRSLNVAEAGIDAGMLALKLAWPTESDDEVVVDDALLKTTLQGDQTLTKLWDPENPSEFLQVDVYDNVDTDGHTTSVPNMDAATRTLWDSNGDGVMFVDSQANVDNDRHRILIQAEKQSWRLTFPQTMALYAGVVDSNGQGLEIGVDNGDPPIYYDVHSSLGKGIDPDEAAGVTASPTVTNFDDIFNNSMLRALRGLAVTSGTYFTDGEAAEDFLETEHAADGKVIYIKSDTAVDIAGDTQVGREDQPVVVIIDTPEGSDNVWDMKGNADLWGVMAVIGNSTLRGTCSTHGSLYCAGTLLNKGNGTLPEVLYNAKCLFNLNRQYTISVNIVPNTWEEYTLPRTSTTVAGP